MSKLIDTNPAFRSVTIMRVDWDTFRDELIVAELEIPRRSTLVMFKGGEEVGRVVAQTSKAAIGALFEAAI